MRVASLMVATITLLTFVSGCQPSSHKATTQSTVTSQARQPKTASLHQRVFTIKHTQFVITKLQTLTSANPDQKMLVIRYRFTNHQSQSVVPDDLWSAHVTAIQQGHHLTTGTLPFSTSQSADNDAMNRSVMPVKPGKTITALTTFTLKNQQAVTLTFKDTHQQVVGHLTHD